MSFSHPDRSPFSPQTLRSGFTTGACAAAAASAAYSGLIGHDFPDPVVIAFPDGRVHGFALTRKQRHRQSALAGVCKDAGDDPDVTHGSEVVVEVGHGARGQGLVFHAGKGVGIVTKPGLPLAVGEPAINTGPRKMIKEALQSVALQSVAAGASGEKREGADDLHLDVTISIPHGEVLAQKTLNQRLGIVGGLSILGSNGRVMPYSCSAWIHAIHRGVDVARAAGHHHLMAATGKTSEQVLRRLTGLPEDASIDMGDFVGGLLKYLRKHPVHRLSVGGGFAKLVKLADGAMDLHSSRSSVDLEKLAARWVALGGSKLEDPQAASAGEWLARAQKAGIPLASHVAFQARTTILAVLAGGTQVDVYVIDRQGHLVGQAP